MEVCRPRFQDRHPYRVSSPRSNLVSFFLFVIYLLLKVFFLSIFVYKESRASLQHDLILIFSSSLHKMVRRELTYFLFLVFLPSSHHSSCLFPTRPSLPTPPTHLLRSLSFLFLVPLSFLFSTPPFTLSRELKNDLEGLSGKCDLLSPGKSFFGNVKKRLQK